MKLRMICISMFFLIFTTVLFSQTGFEGRVKIQVNDEGDSQVMEYLAKNDKFRMESPEGEGTIIFDMKAGKMLILMSEDKMYMEMPLEIPKDVESKIDDEAGSFTRTGETKEILGYNCEKFLFDDEGKKGEAWMTLELGGFMLFDDPSKMQDSGQSWRTEIMQAGYFPVMVNEMDDNGAVQSSFKVLEIEPKTLDAGLFSAPEGFQKFEMPNMNMDNYK
jgi:hypothetical protein